MKRQKKPASAAPERSGALLLYGRHPVMAALANPRRRKKRLIATEKALEALADARLLPDGLPVQATDARTLDQLLGRDAPHQGMALELEPLASPDLLDLLPPAGAPSLIVMLDQVEDPHNVGAILRSAAVFGADAVISQDRHAPPETGVLAKSASGALDVIPWARVTNISATLDMLADHGYWAVGLDGAGETRIDRLDLGQRLVLVLGAEGRGLRPLVAKHCDVIARIEQRPASPLLESLNVSNAAAVALFALTAGR